MRRDFRRFVVALVATVWMAGHAGAQTTTTEESTTSTTDTTTSTTEAPTTSTAVPTTSSTSPSTTSTSSSTAPPPTTTTSTAPIPTTTAPVPTTTTTTAPVPTTTTTTAPVPTTSSSTSSTSTTVLPTTTTTTSTTTTTGAEPSTTTTSTLIASERCDDGVDNDGDDLLDCQDPDCTDDPACPNACSRAPTFASIACRLAALATRIEASPDVHTERARLVVRLTASRTSVEAARAACAASDTKRVRRSLLQSAKRLQQYRKRLRAPAARRVVPGALVGDLLAAGDSLRSDVKTLRSTVGCPDAA